MTKIIAELGINWSGDINIAKDMIVKSKQAGADFCKFQVFNEEVIKDSKYKDELSEMILDFQSLNILRDYAFQQHIGFGVSVMYPEAFDIIRKIGVPLDFIKIRCQDHANVSIARPAVNYCNDYDIPLLISTERYISGYNLYHTKHAKYLYCVPKYPPELNEIHEKYISTEFFDGYSNHFKSKYLPMIAVARNLEYIEIHTKLNDNCIDYRVSLRFDDLKDVCNFRDILSKLK